MELREKAVTPHVAQNTNGRRSAIDGRATRHSGYSVSQRFRNRVEKAFGWAKTVAGLRKMSHRGLLKVGWQFTLATAAYNFARLPKLLIGPAQWLVIPGCPTLVLPSPPDRPGWRCPPPPLRSSGLPRKIKTSSCDGR
jgi:hypothetical protein